MRNFITLAFKRSEYMYKNGIKEESTYIQVHAKVFSLSLTHSLSLFLSLSLLYLCIQVVC